MTYYEKPEFGQFPRSFALNSEAIRLKRAENRFQLGFLSLRSDKPNRLLAWLVLLLLLSACQQTGKLMTNESGWQSNKGFFVSQYQLLSRLDNRKLTAKVAVKTDKLNDQANLIWSTNNSASEQITLYGSFGAGAVKLNFDEAGAQLTDSKGKTYKRSSVALLLSEVIGWPIPVDALSYWLFGLPDPGANFQYCLSANGQLSAIRQLGWEIQYQQFATFFDQNMPRKMLALKQRDGEEVRVKLIAKNWQW